MRPQSPISESDIWSRLKSIEFHEEVPTFLQSGMKGSLKKGSEFWVKVHKYVHFVQFLSRIVVFKREQNYTFQ